MDKKEVTVLLMLVFAFVGVAAMGLLLLGAFFLIFGGDGAAPAGDGGLAGTEAAADTEVVEEAETAEALTERINAIAERIEGIDGVHNGAKFGLRVGNDSYTVGKISSGIQVVEGSDPGTDFDIYMDSIETFEKIEEADDVCAKIRELRNSGEIQYEIHASEMELFFKGYLSMESCIK